MVGEVEEEENKERMRRVCMKQVRDAAQIRCEVFVEYCTASRTQSFVPQPKDRSQYNGFTLQGSEEAYTQRFEALKRYGAYGMGEWG